MFVGSQLTPDIFPVLWETTVFSCMENSFNFRDKICDESSVGVSSGEGRIGIELLLTGNWAGGAGWAHAARGACTGSQDRLPSIDISSKGQASSRGGAAGRVCAIIQSRNQLPLACQKNGGV
jgi:hypothetical protein